MLNSQQLRRVMDGAVSIIVVADCAVEHVVAENAIKCFHLGRRRLRRLGGDLHSIGNAGRAGPHQAAVRFHHASVTRLNRAELRMVTDLGARPASTVDQIDEQLVGFGLLNDAVDRSLDHSLFLYTTRSKARSSRMVGEVAFCCERSIDLWDFEYKLKSEACRNADAVSSKGRFYRFAEALLLNARQQLAFVHYDVLLGGIQK